MMKKITFISVLALSVLLTACRQTPYYKILGEAQGTFYSVTFQGDQTLLSKAEIDSILDAFDASLSTYKPNSLISKINQSDSGIATDPLFDTMFRKAEEVYRNTDGAFDITIAPLVNIYGFGYTEKKETIDSTLIDSLLHYVGMDKIKLESGILHKAHKEVKLDGNAIAQGLSVDVTADYLDKKNIQNYIVEIGGELYAKGKKYNRNWIVSIDKPIEGNMTPGEHTQIKLMPENMAIATSGNYRAFTVIDGKKYSHSIDPKTGKPVFSNLLSATIAAPDCMSADAYATACMILGLDKSVKLIESLPNIEGFFISSGAEGKYDVYYTSGMEKLILK
ncbi:MAG: FAD:protein FMN transferase [Bacteroidota bacterium]|nr:FAD:protein FMN transferase [Bacteroidota bacterium]